MTDSAPDRPGCVFINYRRETDEFSAHAIQPRLQQALPDAEFFLDVDSIPLAEEWAEYLSGKVAECDVMLVLIGPAWLDAAGESGPRLHQKKDFVRYEIASALAQKKRIVPILLGSASVPAREALPEDIAPLVDWQYRRITGERFAEDVEGLAAALREALVKAAEIRRLDAAAQAQAEAERAAEEEEERAARRAEAQKAERDAAAQNLLSPAQIEEAKEFANWSFVERRRDIDEARDHLARFPDGETAKYARDLLEDLVWSELPERPGARELEAFLREFPEGIQAGEARRTLERWEKKEQEARETAKRAAEEAAAWRWTRNADSVEGYRRFLGEFPASLNRKHARRRLRIAFARERGRSILRWGLATALAIALVAIGLLEQDRLLGILGVPPNGAGSGPPILSNAKPTVVANTSQRPLGANQPAASPPPIVPKPSERATTPVPAVREFLATPFYRPDAGARQTEGCSLPRPRTARKSGTSMPNAKL